MRVAIISKAMTVLSTRSKAELLARHAEVHLIIPQSWPGYVEEADNQPGGYVIHRLPILLAGRNHFHVYRGLGKLLCGIQPDILHVDEEPYSLVTAQAFMLARRIGCRVLAFTWQNIVKRYPPPFCWIESLAYRRASAIIAGNQEAVQVLRAKGYRGAAPVIPQFGIDAASIVSERPPAASHRGDDFTVCYVGRLVAEKGINTLIEALSAVPLARLELVGTGPERARLEKLVAEHGIEDRIAFLGGKSSVDIPAYLSTVDVLVLPSVTTSGWKEQFGRVLIEAMAAGVAVIGSSSGEIPQVIGDAGLVFPEGDVTALCESLRTLANAGTRQALAERGLQRCRQFTQEVVVNATLEVYRQALCEGQTSP